MFYVYEWYDKETGVVFYVGKGCRDRYRSRYKRNDLFKGYVEDHDCDSRILRHFDTEEEALEFEKERIAELKREGLAFCNLSKGGSGGFSFSWTDEMRQYKSIFNPMKDPKQRERMSVNNPMKNEDVARRVAEKNGRKVQIDGVIYPSVVKASEHFGVCVPTVSKWCNKGYNPDKLPCRYLDEEQKPISEGRYNKGGCKALVYKGVEYESALDLAKELGLHYSTTSKWAIRGYDPNGNPCRYIDRVYDKPYVKTVNGEYNKKPIIVNGVYYPGKVDAERELGLKKGL